MALAYTLGSSYSTCIQLSPEVSGFPSPTFEQRLCNASNADQVLTLSTTP
jgi:hypothetical protein